MTNMINQLKQFFRPTDIYSSQRFMMIFLMMQGFFPLQITGNANCRRLKVSYLGWIIAVLLIICYLVCFILTLCNKHKFNRWENDIKHARAELELYSSMVGVSLIYGSCLFQSKKFRIFMENIVELDRKLSLLGVQINYRKGLNTNIFCILGFIIVNCTLTTTTVVLHHNDEKTNIPLYSMWSAHFMPPLIYTVITIFFVNNLIEIKQRFEGISQILRQVLRTLRGPDDPNIFHIRQYDEKSKKVENRTVTGISGISPSETERKMLDVLEDTYRIHDDMCDICEIADGYFGYKVLVIITISFILVVFHMFSFLEIARKHETTPIRREMRAFIYISFQICMNCLEVVFIAQSSHAISTENEHFSVYIHKIMNETRDELLKKKLLEFSLKLLHRKVQFTAVNLFPLNRELIFMIVSGITTYLLILVEFRQNANGARLQLF